MDLRMLEFLNLRIELSNLAIEYHNFVCVLNKQAVLSSWGLHWQ